MAAAVGYCYAAAVLSAGWLSSSLMIEQFKSVVVERFQWRRSCSLLCISTSGCRLYNTVAVYTLAKICRVDEEKGLKEAFNGL